MRARALLMNELLKKSPMRETRTLSIDTDRSAYTIFIFFAFEVPWKCPGSAVEVLWK